MDRSLFESQENLQSNDWEQVINLAVDAPRAVEQPIKETVGQDKGVETSFSEAIVHLKWLPRQMWRWFRTGPGEWKFFGPDHGDDERDNGGLNWSAPLAAIQDLSDSCHIRTPRPPDLPPNYSSGKNTLDSILTKEQIIHLINVFDQNYTPWLNFNLVRSENPSPILDLVCCTVSSRHLTDELRKLVAPSLHQVTDKEISKIIFHPRSSGSLEAIQALLIIALWAPVCGTAEEARDGHLILASAISMALNLRLNECPDLLLDARQSGKSMDDRTLEDMTNKAKLWLALANTDTLLSAGRGKSSLSNRGTAYSTLFPVPAGLPFGKSGRQELRSRLLGEVLDATEAALKLRLTSIEPETFEKWHKQARDALLSLVQFQRIIAPLGGQCLFQAASVVLLSDFSLPVFAVLSDIDKSQFHAISIISRCCHVLALFCLCTNWRICASRSASPVPDAQRPNQGSSVPWGKKALILSEGVLLSLIEMDLRLIKPMPDVVFIYIAFVAVLIVAIKFILFNAMRKELPGSGDQLLSKTVDMLRRVGCSPDHPATKCAEVIQGMLTLWLHRERVLAYVHESSSSTASTSAEAPDMHASTSASTSTLTTSPFPLGPTGEPYFFPSEPTQTQANVDFSWLNESLMQEFASGEVHGFLQGDYAAYQ
uniref:Xylanolytic transcriptional activator regulatory domain-containing protein n=1 Tax=Moniliophthora roreri TaxID=221103 RepID=A0A0W0F2X1_MONRR